MSYDYNIFDLLLELTKMANVVVSDKCLHWYADELFAC